jgi:PAS domain S-box-containing protein
MPNPETHGDDKPQPPPPELLLGAIVDSSDDAILSKDLNGIITSWNKGATRIFGYTADEVIGRPGVILLPSDRIDEERLILDRIRRGEQVDHYETRRRRKDGEVIDVSVTISPIRQADGRIVGASKVARDITEQKQSAGATRLLAAIVSSSDDAIVSKNLNGIISSWNAGAERIFGYTPEEAIGRSVLMLVPMDRKDEEPRILERIRRGERIDHFETLRVRKNGEIFPVSLTISPVKNERGTIVGASKIARDITDLKKIAAEREQLLESERTARSQAEHANRMKDEFLSTVSHELRTPLNAIIGWAQVLKDSGSDPAELESGLEVIERNALVQAQLIDDLLDLGRITSGKMILDVEWLDIGAIIHASLESVRHSADLKEIELKTILHNGYYGMMGDKKRLQQVLWNVLSNAIKFTPKRGKVIITVARVNSHLDIAITDNGRGITPEFLPHVFERFRQADSSTTRKYGGLGIGLALVKQLVELHGGTVTAESQGSGHGATFTVSLPVVATRSSAPPSRSGESIESDEMAAADRLTGIKVLAVDDDTDSLEVVKRILLARQADVRTATSVESALVLLTTFTPDVILSDIGMPDKDGYDLIRQVRSLPNGSVIPAAALTALARSEDRMRALQAGFQTHVTKPVAQAELVAVVRSLATIKGAGPRLG